MGRFLKRRIHTVFLMLGNSCNMNCRYCLQHPLVNRQLTEKINPVIYDFLKNVLMNCQKDRNCISSFTAENRYYILQTLRR